MGSGARFEKLMQPGYIGRVRTRNLIIKTASGTGLVEKDGTPGERAIAYYENIARGGVGLLIYEYCSVEYPRGMLRASYTAHLSDDNLIPGYANLVDAVHKQGCPFFMQLMHSGPWYQEAMGFDDRGDRVGPSDITSAEMPPGLFTPVRALTAAEVKALVVTFAKAAVRAQKAGFDGVEINGSHYHLINAFFSGFWNRRHDAYGCDSLEDRARFMCDIIREAKKACGADYPITALFNAVEYGIRNGTTIEEAKRFAQLIEEAGADAIQVRAAGYGPFSGILHADRFRYPELPDELKIKEFDWTGKGKGITVPLGSTIKQVVSKPVFVAGRLDPELGETLLKEGKLDFIGMTRRLFADPELPTKVAEGRLEDIAPCSGCNYCWHIRAYVDTPLRCRINAALGREREFEITPAVRKRKVLVVGGGPSGMEAARVAALRGHEVTLCEKEPKLGGLMRLAAMVKDLELEAILDTIRYLSTQMTKLGVTIRTGQALTSSLIDEIKPDVLILATGGVSAVPGIPGIDNKKVVDNMRLHRTLKFYLRFLGPKTLELLTRLWMPIGKKVVIIGGGLEGCQLAEFLVRRGRHVTIAESSEQLGKGLLSDDPDRLFKWFEKKGVTTLNQVRYEMITSEGLQITTKSGEKRTLYADTIITTLPLQATPNAAKGLAEKVSEVHQIGDCREPGYMYDAIADGYRIGRLI